MSTNTLSLAIIGILTLSGLLGGGPALPDAPSASSPAAVGTSSQEGALVEIRSDEVWVRETPGGTGKTATLTKGSRVTRLGQAGEWVQVRLADGREGWVSGMVVGSPSRSGATHQVGEVWAYYVEDGALSSWPSFDLNADRLTGLLPWSLTVDARGQLAIAEGFSESSLARVLERAGRAGLQTQLLVQNVHDGSFDEERVHGLLRDPDARARAAEAMASQAQAWGVRGVHLDLENVPPHDRSYLTAFVSELSQRLHEEGLELTMALPAKTWDNPSHTWSGAFDYAALAPHLDRAVLMAYDEHSRTGSPGPIASAPWVEDVVQYALSAGLDPEEILLGVAAYGYDWPEAGSATALTHPQVMSLLDRQESLSPQVSLQWDATARVPYFSYGSGNQVWFEDRESLAYKLEIVEAYGLGGVALWRLGQEDPGSWTLMAGR